MDDEAPILHYDPRAGSLRLRLTGGEEILLRGLGPDLPMWVDGPGVETRAPLWLSAAQADVLGKMIDYILQRVKVSAASRQVLEALAPRVAQLDDELKADQEPPLAAVPSELDDDGE